MTAALQSWLPIANTSLIMVSGFFLLLGYYFIRHKRVLAHHRSMVTASVFAALFLVVYVTRALLFETKVFAGEGWLRVLYLGILISHVILATLIAPFVLVTMRRALRREFVRHRQVARVTFPMWLYVVVTGWIIYLMLYALPAGFAGSY